jgi:hypothetical protein
MVEPEGKSVNGFVATEVSGIAGWNSSVTARSNVADPLSDQTQEIIMTKTLSALAAGLCVLTLSLGSYAASDEYKAAKKQAGADYKMAKAECKKLSGTEKKSCMKRAKAEHEAAEERAKALK